MMHRRNGAVISGRQPASDAIQEINQSSKQVFLSYSHTDREASIALRSALEQAGLSIFQDEYIRKGDRWVTRLEEALLDCCAFVLLVGRDGVQRWVGRPTITVVARSNDMTTSSNRRKFFI